MYDPASIKETGPMSRLPWRKAMPALAALALCLPVSRAAAQALPQVEQAQQVQRIRELQPGEASPEEDPSLYPGEEEDTGRQLLLQTAPPQKWSWVDVSLDSQYFYTSNAYLTTTQKTSAALLVSTINGEIEAPPLNVPFGLLYGRAGYQYQWFDYGLGGPASTHGLDFDAATTYVEGEYELPDDWYVIGNLSYTRLLFNGGGFDEFYKELVPSLRIQKAFQLSSNVNASIEYLGNFRFTDEPLFPNLARDCNNRTDQSIELAVTWQFAQRMDVRPFYSFQYSYYPSYFAGQSRNDYLHTLGMYADYYINSWSSIRVFVTYDIFNSDAASVQDYRKLDAGGGISAAFKF
jgi:hypothetical protein